MDLTTRTNTKDKQQQSTGKGKAKVVAVAGAAAAVAAAIAFFAGKSIVFQLKRSLGGYPGIKIRVNLTASEILNLADQIISKSKQVHDSVAAVPLDKVAYNNVVLPLAELDGEQFHLVQSCVFPRMIASSKVVREASLEAEKKIDAHNVDCR